MTAGEIIGVLDNSQRLQVIEDGKTLFCGWVALLSHDENEERIKAAQVKRFCPRLEINHKQWREKRVNGTIAAGRNPGLLLS